MNESDRKVTSILLFILAFCIGLFHFFQGFISIFVFKENEPILSWVCILSGPISTLPATIATMFHKKIGGYWLISGGIITGLSFIWLTKTLESLIFIFIITVPMVLLGPAFLKLYRKKEPNISEWGTIPQNIKE